MSSKSQTTLQKEPRGVTGRMLADTQTASSGNGGVLTRGASGPGRRLGKESRRRTKRNHVGPRVTVLTSLRSNKVKRKMITLLNFFKK